MIFGVCCADSKATIELTARVATSTLAVENSTTHSTLNMPHCQEANTRRRLSQQSVNTTYQSQSITLGPTAWKTSSHALPTHGDISTDALEEFFIRRPRIGVVFKICVSFFQILLLALKGLAVCLDKHSTLSFIFYVVHFCFEAPYSCTP